MGTITSVLLATVTSYEDCAISVLPAVSVAVAQPQFLEKIRERFLNSENNPCGAGVKPESCTCPDGTVFTPGSGQGRRPCGGSGAPTCTCPDGSTFTPDREKIRDKIQQFLGSQQE